MKITFVGHASILIETGGLSILSDPWWRGPCFGAQWWSYPRSATGILDTVKPDYIYISHGHHDHLHPGTLKTFSRDTKILVGKSTNMGNFIREMGFEVIELGDQEISLGESDVRCRIMPTYSDDTLMAISSEGEVCININDALHSAPLQTQREMVTQLRAMYPSIDYVFCGYGTASHFPNCYVIPGKNSAASAARRQAYFNRQWAKLIDAIQPRFGFPFAADVVFLERDLQWANEAVHNSERPTKAFNKLFSSSSVRTIDIAPGFVIENGAPVIENLWQPVVLAQLQSEYSAEIERANRYGNVTTDSVQEVADLLRKSVEVHSTYLLTGERDFRFLICFRNCEHGILIEKRKDQIQLSTVATSATERPNFDVMYTTRLAYLKNSLTQRYGDEILFVGSGGIFEYADRSLAKLNLHRELQPLLRKSAPGVVMRYGKSSKHVFKFKQAVKKLIGRGPVDLYDLNMWTVFNEPEGTL